MNGRFHYFLNLFTLLLEAATAVALLIAGPPRVEFAMENTRSGGLNTISLQLLPPPFPSYLFLIFVLIFASASLVELFYISDRRISLSHVMTGVVLLSFLSYLFYEVSFYYGSGGYAIFYSGTVPPHNPYTYYPPYWVSILYYILTATFTLVTFVILIRSYKAGSPDDTS
ncbi:MAG: hypothetical protein ACYDBK_01155 [Thermoplasmataceae archaeon]